MNRLFWCLVAAAFALPNLGTAAETIIIASGESAEAPEQPQLAITRSGAIHVAYGIGNSVVYARSEDGGRTFAQPMRLPGTNVLALGMRRGPRIAAAGQFVCITAIGGRQGKGRDGDVLAYASADGGKTWTGPVTVNDAPDAAREGLHAMAAGPKGEIACVWLDLRNGKTEIFAAVSEDHGQSWAKNVLVYRSPDGHVCECCHPSAAYDGEGNLHVMWRNWLGGARDMYVARSTDSGRSFGKDQKLGKGTWPLDACPMDGGYLAASPKGEVFTAWRRENAVFLTRPSSANEEQLGPGAQPWIAFTSQGPYVVWLEDGSDRLLLRTPGNSDAMELAAKAAAPVIAASLEGQGPVVAAWEERRGKRSTIHCRVLALRSF
jgi:hypothetical protein